MLIIGVDEAGRGSVLGPLVICAFAIEEDASERLRAMGIKDSKLLGAKERERLASIISHYPHEIVKISAEEITDYMKRKVSLNEMEAEKIAGAIIKLAARAHNIDRVIVDSPDPVPRKFEIRIRKYLHGSKLEKIKIVSENKADFNYPVVSAASVLAKSGREKEVAKLRAEFGEDVGAGYPSDEVTIEFLRRNLKNPKLQKHIRHKWSTMERLKMTEVKLEDFF